MSNYWVGKKSKTGKNEVVSIITRKCREKRIIALYLEQNTIWLSILLRLEVGTSRRTGKTSKSL